MTPSFTTANAPLTVAGEQLEILKHTHRNGRFCGDSPDMQILVQFGFMRSLGRVSFVPEEYFGITESGREVMKRSQEKTP